MNNFHPKFIILIAYKAKNGNWRGFCSPYDITCEAYTLKQTKQKLMRLVELYEDGLKKYNYPQHLAFRQLTEKEDQRIFKMALKVIAEDFKKKFTEKNLEYQKNKEKEEVSMKNPHSHINYYQPSYAF